MRTVSKLAAAMVLGFAASATAIAAPQVSIGGWDVGEGDNVTVRSPVNFGTAASRFTANVVWFTGIASDSFVDAQGSIFGYCYDIFEVLARGGNDYDVDYSGVTQSSLEFLAAVNATIEGGDEFDWLNPVDRWQAAAIQIGLWETLYDDEGRTGFNLAGGDFNVKPRSLEARTADALDAILANYNAAGMLDASSVMVLRASGNGRGQDVLIGRHGVDSGTLPPIPAGAQLQVPEEPHVSASREVPEPGMLALLGAAALAVGGARRRRK
jgi:hypothetical protein